MTEEAGFQGEIKIDEGQSGSFSVLANVNSADTETLRSLLDASALGDEGERRIGGRVDFTLSVELYWDPANESTHTDLLDAIVDDTLVDVEVYPVSGESFNITATCRVSTASISISGGSTQSKSVDLENADGSKWAYST